MGLANIVSAIDGSFAPAKAVKKSLGRRLALAGTLAGLGIAGGSRLMSAAAEDLASRQAASAAPLPPPPPVTLVARPQTEPCAAERRDWSAFQARFIRTDGRVIDTANKSVSHTEGQGVGMLLAVAFGDRASFDRIWGWTATHLSRANDALHAWRYIPGQANPVPDQNNATDGDIYIAAALVRASERWNSPAYLKAGQMIARDILQLLVVDVGGRTVLLPGATGFIQPGRVLVNASYYVFPLLTELAAAHPSPVWAKLLKDGRTLIADAQFGRWQLPPDWLSVSRSDGKLSLAEGRPPRFSFDAVRIPLFVAWDGAGPEVLRRFTAFWGSKPAEAPAWVDLTSGTMAPYATCGGVIAIAALASPNGHARSQAGMPAISERDDYYSSAIILLSRMALREIGGRIA